jgi:glyoxylase-like metal-dependent hydrolase (beta-lactamase superfamily II)
LPAIRPAVNVRRVSRPRALFAAALALAIVLAGAYLWFTVPEAVPATSDFVLDVAELRRLANDLPGRKPLRVRSELVAETAVPRAAVFAGESFTPHAMAHQVFQVQYEDGYVLIDAGFPEALLERMRGGTYHAEGFARVRAALGRAKQVVLTHEHPDHAGGVAVIDESSGAAARLRLTPEQLADADVLAEAGIGASLRAALRSLEYARTAAIAPGIAVQKAPGHSPGTQLIFVATEDGVEFLFVGDVAWHVDQIVQRHYRPRFVTDFLLNEDRNAVLAQLATLSEVIRGEPNLVVVVSHDADQRTRLVGTGALLDRVEP